MTAQIRKSDLTTKAMLVSLSISKWNATKDSTEASEVVNATFHTDEKSGRYKKNLAAKDALKDIKAIESAARAFHMENTRPWLDDGQRILPAKNYDYYSDNMRSFNNKFQEAVDEFLIAYPKVKEDAKQLLQGLYKDEDYPTIDQMKKKHSFKVGVSPIPSANDFRVTQITDQDIEKIKSQIEAQQAEIEKELAKDLWERLHDVLSKAFQTFNDPDAKFRDSKIDNISEVIETIRRLNMEENARLERICNVVEERICNLDPAEIRKNADERKEAAEQAESLLDIIGTYL